MLAAACWEGLLGGATENNVGGATLVSAGAGIRQSTVLSTVKVAIGV